MQKIPNYQDYYVTKDGRIWSNKSNKYLKPRPDKRGYYQVALPCGKGFKNRFIHQLVLETFVGKRKLGQVCRHLNGKPQDNRLENLCWGTRSENQQDRIRHNTLCAGQDNCRAKLTNDEVNFVRWVNSYKIFTKKWLGNFFNLSSSGISAILLNKTYKYV